MRPQALPASPGMARPCCFCLWSPLCSPREPARLGILPGWGRGRVWELPLLRVSAFLPASSAAMRLTGLSAGLEAPASPIPSPDPSRGSEARCFPAASEEVAVGSPLSQEAECQGGRLSPLPSPPLPR